MKIIQLTNQGGATYQVNFGDVVYSFVLKYNYTAECWTMDILDSVGTSIVAGIMLLPDIDLLDAYPSIQAVIGTLIVIEKNPGDYKLPDSLGTTMQLAWSAV